MTKEGIRDFMSGTTTNDGQSGASIVVQKNPIDVILIQTAPIHVPIIGIIVLWYYILMFSYTGFPGNFYHFPWTALFYDKYILVYFKFQN